MRFASAVLLALTACGTDVRTSSPQGTTSTEPDAGVDASSSSSSPTDGGASDAAPLTDCEEATYHSDFAWIQQKVFNVSCLTGCHSGPNPTSNMDLSAGRAWSSLVNVSSNQYSGWVRVVPGDSPHSMLMVQLGGEPGPQLEGYMPWNQPRLCNEKIDAIRRWIIAGAPQ